MSKMSIKNVVKVMNFHSLLRVDSAKKQAEKYKMMEEEVTYMIDYIVNNRNFTLDKKILKPDPKKPILNIYIGSDYGFCSNYNSQINNLLIGDSDSEKILVGKKLRKNQNHTIFQCTKEEFSENMNLVEEVIEKSIKGRSHREINIIYNHYYNAGDIRLEKKAIYPVTLTEKGSHQHIDDFVVETDINTLLRDLVIAYIGYIIRICVINSNAAENVLRQNTTSESLKKIDEREEESLRIYRKEKKAKEFRKVIENFAKLHAK